MAALRALSVGRGRAAFGLGLDKSGCENESFCLGGGRVSWTFGRGSEDALAVSGISSLVAVREFDVGNE